MLTKKLLLTLLFSLIFSGLLSAATFTVTSNADSGPGTLREALSNAAANGILTQDIITFNLPGNLVSDRVIRLKSQLPGVSSNLIIDASTQPGAVFGISDARVIIEPEVTPAYFNALNIFGEVENNVQTAKGIEIYGLYIRNFAQITNLSNPNTGQGSGIVISCTASAIKIGAPGKGNVICNNINGVINNNYFYNAALSDISVQSNIIGLLDDGFTPASNITGLSLIVDGTVQIGGAAAIMGNVISANVTGVSIAHNYYYTNLPVTVNIQNNKIGTNFAGTADFKNTLLFQQSAFIKTYGIYINAPNTTANIKNNLVSGQRFYGIYIENTAYTITGNKIGTDISGTADLGNGEGIMAGISSSGSIGGTTAADINLIGFNNYGIESLNSSHTLITRNSIFCNKDYGISVLSNQFQVPYVKVLNFSSTKVSGQATPNANIELFFSDACGENCQGKTYITTVTANATGDWAYTGTISGAVLATATDAANNTSPFSSLVIQPSEVDVKNYTCAYSGSVTIKQNITGLLFHWDKKEQSGILTPLGNTQNITNLLPGTYQLTVQYPGGCQKTAQLFDIKDARIKIQNILPPVPECRQKFFPIDVNFTGGTGNITFAWKNAAGDLVSSAKQAILPGGTFTLTIADEAGCSVTIPAGTITPKPGPDYDLSTMVVTTARCGIAEGSIKNITTYVGIGTLSYKWFDSAGKQVGSTKDLNGVKGGFYTLQLSDQSQCSPYSTTPIYIQETNSVDISAPAIITQPTCGADNGALYGIYVTNADFFQWTGPNGILIPTTPTNYSSLSNLAEGVYTLYAKNTLTGCDNSRQFSVIRLAPEVFSISKVAVTPATCQLNNGAIRLDLSGAIKPATYQWLDANDAPMGNTNEIKGLAPGTYKLIVTDKYGCPSTLLSNVEVVNTPLLAFAATNNPVSTPDQCNQNLGTVSGVAVTGGVEPYNYKWINKATGDVAGTTAGLPAIGKGDYTLTVTDATPCAIPLNWDVSVGNEQFVPDAPALTNLRICDPEVVNLVVLHPITGNYNLYADNTSTTPLQTSSKGIFNVNVTQTTDYFISYNIGTCESPRTKVNVEVVLVDVKFPNAFTPNGDGTNDYWKITGLQKFPGTVVQVFSRAGLKVFESKEYATPFDGKHKGSPLPTGVYYYIINLNTPCSLLSGYVTVIR